MGKMLRGPSAITVRSDYGNAVRGPVFAAKFQALKDAVCAADPAPVEDPAVAPLVSRIVQLRRTVRADVGRVYRSEVNLHLDIMCLHLCGITAEEADRKERERALAAGRAVPAELGSMLGGNILSGGLPTLGRRRR